MDFGIRRAPPRGLLLIGSLIGANFNTTADQPISILLPAGARFRINNIFISTPSISLTTAVGGIYTGAGKTGAQVVPNSQGYSALTTNAANTTGSLLVATVTNANTVVWDALTLYFALTTPQGSAATADIHIVGIQLG